MRNSTGWTALLSLAVVAFAGVASAESTRQTTPAQGEVPAPTGRLKFRSAGPVCICGNGLSEKEIEQSTAKSKAGKDADSDSGSSGRSQVSDQEKNLNSGVAK